MGILEPERTDAGPHPRREPRFDGPLTLEALGQVFEGCADYMERRVYLHGDRARTVTVCYLLGMTRNERLSDYILRPLAQDPAPQPGPGGGAVFPAPVRGAVQPGGQPADCSGRGGQRPDPGQLRPCFSPGGPMCSPCRCPRRRSAP